MFNKIYKINRLIYNYYKNKNFKINSKLDKKIFRISKFFIEEINYHLINDSLTHLKSKINNKISPNTKKDLLAIINKELSLSFLDVNKYKKCLLTEDKEKILVMYNRLLNFFYLKNIVLNKKEMHDLLMLEN